MVIAKPPGIKAGLQTIMAAEIQYVRNDSDFKIDLEKLIDKIQHSPLLGVIRSSTTVWQYVDRYSEILPNNSLPISQQYTVHVHKNVPCILII